MHSCGARSINGTDNWSEDFNRTWTLYGAITHVRTHSDVQLCLGLHQLTESCSKLFKHIDSCRLSTKSFLNRTCYG